MTFGSPGTYSYICHLPGHEAYGMVGTIVVTGTGGTNEPFAAIADPLEFRRQVQARASA